MGNWKKERGRREKERGGEKERGRKKERRRRKERKENFPIQKDWLQIRGRKGRFLWELISQ